ncbi:hypothetical protein BJ912DRAFT_993589 [Pholiota molesta]|nr:hypothetical protein BJ912DRAFT_993589 [Pholiota molesta]
MPVYDPEEWATVEDTDPQTGSSTQVTISWEALHVTRWKPYPRYTVCTPASRNVKRDEDLDFAWQNDYLDPDLEMIEMEVSRRLLYKHNFSIEDVDSLDILTHPLRETNKSGIIWYSRQRDFPWWTGAEPNELPHLESDRVDLAAGPYENVTKDNPTFCADLNCMFVNCGYHKPSPPIPSPQPTMTADMIRQNGQPCKNDCYKSIDEDNINMMNTHWDEADNILFRGVMKLVPDTTPCNLAIICRKPCVEMFVERLNFFSDEDLAADDEREGNQRLRAFRAIKFGLKPIISSVSLIQNTSRITAPSGPCDHPGPCNQYADCVCYRNKHRCLRNCRCSLKCEIRYKGCKCRPGKRQRTARHQAQCCIDERLCLCRRLQRECDPELCKGCNAKSTHKSDCANTELQQNIFLPIRIKESAYGLGAFAMTPIKSQAYIGEYVGELSIETGNSFLSPLQNHVGLNYTFGIFNGGNTLLDSWNLGNETRYLNHSESPNCQGMTLFVNGTHRIVLYALEDIKSGAELTLNYGEAYWQKTYPVDSFDPADVHWEAYA